MKFPSFLRLFAARSRRVAPPRRQRRKAGRFPRAASRAQLSLDHLEDRTLLAVLPAPNVISQPVFPTLGGGNANTPSVAVDPTDPQRAVAVYTAFNPSISGTQKA